MDRLEKSEFFTSALPASQRFQAWQDSISVLFDVSPPGPHAPDDFDATLSSYLIDGQCVISRCETRAQHFERSEVHQARDGLDHYLIQVMLSGSQRVEQGSGEATFTPGSLMVIDLASRHAATAADFSHLSLVVPRALLAPLLRHPDAQASRVLRADEPLVRVAFQHLVTLFDIAEHVPAAQAAKLLPSTVALFAAALNGSQHSVDKGPNSVARSLLLRAKLEIERTLSRQLPVEHFCVHLGVSKATLYRLFEPFGGVRAYIQERRLRRCAQLLTAPEYPERHIYEIAYSLGFKSEAHFSRAFRQRFLLSPSEAREMGMALTSQRPQWEPDWFDERIGDRIYEHWISSTLKS